MTRPRITDGPTIYYPDRRPLVDRIIAKVVRALVAIAWVRSKSRKGTKR